MPLPLPNLDDRRWADLVDEARSLIPFYAPEWTDHNVHDPGITLLELYAWLAEMDIYEVNRITGRHRLKFLALVGLRPEPPTPARTVLGLTLKAGAPPLSLPAGVEFVGDDPFGVATGFCSLAPITVVDAPLATIQVMDAGGLNDVTLRWQQGKPVTVFGADPRPGAAVYFGFIESLYRLQPITVAQPVAVPAPVSLYIVVHPDTAVDDAERSHVMDEIAAGRAACLAPEGLVVCDGAAPGSGSAAASDALATTSRTDATGIAHHSARTVWEFHNVDGVWQRLDTAVGEILDHTRAFTLNGPVVVQPPRDMRPLAIGQVAAARFYLRCRFVAGAYDEAPELHAVAVNGVRAEQAVTPAMLTTGLPGDAAIKVEKLGEGDGTPIQAVRTSEQPIVESSLRVYAVDFGTQLSLPWTLRADFDASDRTDAHFTLDATTGEVTFGDGEYGRLVPTCTFVQNGLLVTERSTIYAAYLATRAEAGNLAAGTVTKLADSHRNREALALPGPDFDHVQDELTAITNPIPAAGGAAAETLAHAEGRALELVDRVERAVTLKDYEELALKTPGTRLVRAHALANTHAAFPCFRATGIITVVVVPHLPATRPMPSRGLRQAVAAYLARRRVIGTRVEVVGPTYREITVRATVRAHAGASTPAVRQRVVEALDTFFHPLHGGPDGKGWPFGRDVYRSEVLQVIDQTSGVDHVLDLELIAAGGEPTCGNVCLGPIGLVAAGKHVIEVVRG